MTHPLKAARERVEHEMDKASVYGFDTAIVAQADLRTILAALDEQEWRPIETAPVMGKGADRFDVWRVRPGREGQYERATGCWKDDQGRIYAPRHVANGSSVEITDATHWRPLPAPPVEVKG